MTIWRRKSQSKPAALKARPAPGRDNLGFGADGDLNHKLAILRGGTSSGRLATTADIAPGVKLFSDPVLELQGEYRSPAGALLELDVKAKPQNGAWAGLHFLLGAADMQDAGVIGFAARIAAPETLMLKACVRSGTPEGFVDCLFDKHLLFRAEEASHVDALPIGRRENLPRTAPWRELILFLPLEDFELSLLDLRVFIV